MLFSGQKAVSVRATLIGERIDVRPFARSQVAKPLAQAPLVLQPGAAGVAVVSRHGVVVLFGMTAAEEQEFLEEVSAHVIEPRHPHAIETTELVIDPAAAEGIDGDGRIRLQSATVERLQVITEILTKSLVLDIHEVGTRHAFERIAPIAESLRRNGRTGPSMRQLLRHTGAVLQMQHNTVARAEVGEKPDLLWDHPRLEPLYDKLADEYELVERDKALDRKLALIAQTVSTSVSILEGERTLRVEWYIVILIVVEIVLTLYQMVAGGRH